MGKTFVSYSRKQLYFAEAIALHLQKQGVDVWFDLQQLGAGVNWASTLKDGYENCERLVLVASKSALASPYVEIEWDTALKNGREVILAVIENVEIPEKLHDCPVIDFRANFNRGMKNLVAYLSGKSPAPRDPISAPGKFPYPLNLPISIWLTLFSLSLPYIWAFLGSFAFLNPEKVTGISVNAAVITIVIVFLLGAGAIWFGACRFWSHDLDYQGLRNLSLMALFVLVFALLFTSHGPFFLPTVVTSLIILFFYIWTLNRSSALLRWFSAGQAPQNLRRRIHGKLLKKGAELANEEFKFQPINFALHYEPCDKPMAMQVSKVFRTAGHCESKDPGEAQRHLYVISNRTRPEMLEQAGQRMKGDSIFLLGSSIDWTDSLASAGKTQFVDIREHDTNDVKMLANSLANMDAWRRQYALEATPKKFEDFDAPVAVQFYRYFAYVQVATILAQGLHKLSNGSIFSAVLVLLLGAGFFTIVERALQRKVPFYAIFGALGGMFLLQAVLSWNYLIFPPYLLVTLGMLGSAQSWFPAPATLAKDTIGMDANGKSRRWGRVLVTIATIANYIMLIYFM